MNGQYFSQNPEAKSRETEIVAELRGTSLRFITDHGTFSKGRLDEGSALLLQSLPALTGRAADLGAGWGPIGCFLAAWNEGLEITLIEPNERAAALAGRNAALNQLGNVRILCGDGRKLLPPCLDFILTNPPIRAGKALVYGLFAAAHAALKAGGTLYLVIRRQQGAESAQTHLQTLFSSVECIARKKGFWVLRCIK
ncbi:MAG: methyltransferase [Christensenellaceae bacterium]|nr:methyltransferase [Christensenellaceae bacterium]